LGCPKAAGDGSGGVWEAVGAVWGAEVAAAGTGPSGTREGSSEGCEGLAAAFGRSSR
jgi:hypothetical protein